MEIKLILTFQFHFLSLLLFPQAQQLAVTTGVKWEWEEEVQSILEFCPKRGGISLFGCMLLLEADFDRLFQNHQRLLFYLGGHPGNYSCLLIS